MKRNWRLITLLSILVISASVLIYQISFYKPAPSSTSYVTQPSPETETISQPIIIYGDSRTGNEIHKKIVADIMSKNPEIVFHTGDLVEDGDEKEDWDIFNNITAQMMKKIKFYPTLGNHEKNSKLYYNNFVLPNNERWYQVDLDNFYFIVLDSNASLKIGSVQYNWLEKNLKRIAKENKFIVAVFHHPPFSTGPHVEDEKGLKATIVPLFEKYGVDLVVNGHDHDYERSFYNNIYYIVTGGGGAPLYGQIKTSPYSQKFIKKYNFCELKIVDGNLVVLVYDLELNLIDEIKIKNYQPS